MEYILCNKNHPVCRLVINQNGLIEQVVEVYEKAYAPVGVVPEDKFSLYEWWKGRSIPASREGLSSFLLQLDIPTSSVLPLKSLGLSLSDQYWIKPVGSGLTWEQVNFFANPFSADVGEAFFDAAYKEQLDLMSPDNTSDGWLPKKWISYNGAIYLVKAGSKAFYQEPFNEVIASRIMERLQVGAYVKYSLLEDAARGFCSTCKNFITPATELVPAYALAKAVPKAQGEAAYEHFLRIARELRIPGMQEALENMLVLDYLIANEDRHAGNFGVIREVDSLQYVGCAPLYDNGTSLWHNSQAKEIGATVAARPFCQSHEAQLALVKNWERFDFGKLEQLPEEVEAILSLNPHNLPERTQAIAQAVRERLASIKLHQRQVLGVFADAAAYKAAAVKTFQSFKLTTEPIFTYYRDYCGAVGKLKYNPELDKKIYAQMLQDGFTKETCRRVLTDSPNIKSPKMLDILERSMRK